ncbi:MAG: glycosyltransferase [Thermomicrobiales bacterium]
MPYRVSVVIPTYNRWDKLRRVLDGYREQSIPAADFEVLVCDDGSTDETPDRVRAYAQDTPYTLRHLRQENSGPATARNRGLRAAEAPVVVLTDDDCVPRADFLARHLASTRRGIATIGYIDWHPEIDVTPFMAFLSPGYRFNFAQITDPQHATFRCFYTANVSVWRDDVLALDGFDEHFPAAAYEDIELGYRLHKAGIRLVYDELAIIDHLHEMRLEGMLRSQVINGQSAAYAVQKHPELAIEAGIPGLRDPGITRRFYRAALDYYFVAGLQRGLKEEFGGEWAAHLGEMLDAQPAYRQGIEHQFFQAQDYALRLESRVAQLERALSDLARQADSLDQALRAANPVKQRIQQTVPGLARLLARLRRRAVRPAAE